MFQLPSASWEVPVTVFSTVGAPTWMQTLTVSEADLPAAGIVAVLVYALQVPFSANSSSFLNVNE